MESVKDFANSMDSLAYSWFQKTKLKDSQISTDHMLLLISTHLLADDDDNDGNDDLVRTWRTGIPFSQVHIYWL